MIHITIIGAGSYGKLITNKYKKFANAQIKAVVSRNQPKSKIFSDVPFFNSAAKWKNKFGKPDKEDIFDICAHHYLVIDLLEDFIAIGAKNFILPKPIALNRRELLKIQNLASRHKLKILVASQWHYSNLVGEISDFVKKNRKEISSVRIVFSRSFKGAREKIFTSKTAFLPHILQILIDTRLISKKSSLVIENYSNKKIKISYKDKIKIDVESDISGKEGEETLKIFLRGDKKPTLIANFSGVLDPDGFIIFPSLIVAGNKHQAKEDILEKMIGNSLKYFKTGATDLKTLTLDRYLTVALEEIRVAEKVNKLVVVIGGGIFGTLAALEVAKKGYSVVILERSSELITGASLVNQCRVHMGYHYPRDEKTARDSRHAKDIFEKFFSRAIVKDLNNYYLIAKEDSLTKRRDFEVFCKKLNLPYEESWPKKTRILKDKISLSFKVPERIFDANVIREILEKKIAEAKNVTLLTGAEVFGIKKINDGYNVQFNYGGEKRINYAATVVNATYGNINIINKMAGFELQDYQYELCEVPVARTPWRKTGWSIIDGPFFGIMPFGFSKDYLFYDVELSVLERVVGKFPVFKKSIEYYDEKERREKRFDILKEKWRLWFPDVKKCQSISSMYVTRIVLPKKEKTDTRPTIVKEIAPGFWQIFSGKISISVPKAVELAELVQQFLKKNK